jgi:hypothetical protein
VLAAAGVDVGRILCTHIMGDERLLASTSTGIFTLSPAPLGLRAERVAATQLGATILFAQNATHVLLFANATGWLHMLRLDTGALTAWVDTGVGPTMACGTFWAAPTLYFVTSNSTAAVVVDVLGRALHASTGLPPSLSEPAKGMCASVGVFAVYLVMDLSLVVYAPSLPGGWIIRDSGWHDGQTHTAWYQLDTIFQMLLTYDSLVFDTAALTPKGWEIAVEPGSINDPLRGFINDTLRGRRPHLGDVSGGLSTVTPGGAEVLFSPSDASQRRSFMES